MADPVQPPDRPRLRDLIEPGARHPGFPRGQDDDAWDNELKASIAISLKRIADAVNAPGLDFHTINSNVEQMAWNAGRSFQHGTRTDR